MHIYQINGSKKKKEDIKTKAGTEKTEHETSKKKVNKEVHYKNKNIFLK
jgi:hypothetical protein